MVDVELNRWSKAPYVFINSDGDVPSSLVNALEDELSYEVPDAEWTDAWKSGEWDGRRRLLYQSQNGSYYFPVGLIDRALEVLDVFDVDYEVTGLERPGPGPLDFDWSTDMVLRDHQQEAIDECLQYGSGTVVIPTGGGKTVIGLRLMYELQWPTLVTVHQQTIADQWAEQIESILGVEPAICYGGTRENGDVMVALYQSIYDEDSGDVRDDVRLDHRVLLSDEAHRVAADTFSAVTLAVNAEYRYGFTATPEREDNATLRIIGGTGPVIADLSPERLIDEGYLAEPEWEILRSPKAGGNYQIWQDEYTGEIVENDRRNQLVSDVVEDLERPTLVTVERVNHGERLASMIPDAVFIHGNTPNRDDIVQAFRDGWIDVLIGTRGIVGEGFDVPEIASFVVAGGMQSRTSTIQQVGRALRPDTETATIVDFADEGSWIGRHTEKRLRTYMDYYGEKYGP